MYTYLYIQYIYIYIYIYMLYIYIIYLFLFFNLFYRGIMLKCGELCFSVACKLYQIGLLSKEYLTLDFFLKGKGKR